MIDDILKEISLGYDGLIRSVSFKAFDSVSVEISARKKLGGNWINVRFVMKGVLEFCVKQKINYSNTVLSSGICHKIIDGVNYIDFCPFTDEADGVDDFRMSDVYFASKSIEYEIIPYSE